LLALVFGEIIELEVGVVGPPSLLAREQFHLTELKLSLLDEVGFSSLKSVEAIYEFCSFFHKLGSRSSLIIFSDIQSTD
jgi:hypothetical protein